MGKDPRSAVDTSVGTMQWGQKWREHSMQTFLVDFERVDAERNGVSHELHVESLINSRLTTWASEMVQVQHTS